MNDDKDNVRVDLLKFRRKAYLSYPENSPERKNFIKTILQNELRLVKNDIPQYLIQIIADGDSAVFKNAVKQFALWFWFSILCFIAFFGLQSVLHSFAYFFVGVGAACLTVGANYLYGYWLYRKSVKAVEQYSNDMKKYMSRISNDIKRLDGPR